MKYEREIKDFVALTVVGVKELGDKYKDKDKVDFLIAYTFFVVEKTVKWIVSMQEGITK